MAGGLVLEKTKSSFHESTNGTPWPLDRPARLSQTSSVQGPKADSPTNGLKVSSGRKYASRPASCAVTCTTSNSAPFVVKERNSNVVTGFTALKLNVLVCQPASATMIFVATAPLVRTTTTGEFGG